MPTMTDLSLTISDTLLNIRSAGVVTWGEKILVCRIPPDEWWFLPGGRVKAGESSRAALERELVEELGGAFTIQRPVVCSENFFVKDSVQFHELCTYYEVVVEDPATLSLEGSREEFRWISRTDVESLDIKPEFMKQHLRNSPTSLELVIFSGKD